MTEPASKPNPANTETGIRKWTPPAVARVAVMVIATVLAALLIDSVIYTTLPRFDAEARQAARHAANWVRPAAERQRRAIDETRRIMETIAGLSSLPDTEPARCQAFFASQLESLTSLTNLGVIRPDGQVLCSAQPYAMTDADAASLYKEARRSGLGLLPIAGTGSMLLGVPMRSEPGSALTALVFAVRTLPDLAGQSAEGDGAGEMEVEFFTQSGLILARQPDPEIQVGRVLPDVPLIRRAAEGGSGSGKLAGPDGVSRFYAFVPVEGPGTDRRYLAAGLPVAVVHADARHLLYIQLAALALLVAVVAVLAGVGGDRFLQQRFLAFANPAHWASRLRTYWRGRPTGLLEAAGNQLRRLQEIADRHWLKRRSGKDLELTIESLQRSASEMAKLNDMNQLLQTCVSIEELHGVVARFAQELFPGNRGALYLISESGNLMEAAVAWGEADGKTEVFMPEDCWAVRLGKTHGSEDAQAGPQCAHVAEFPPGGYLCVPMVVHGHVLGILHLRCETAPSPQTKEQEDTDRAARRQLAESFTERTALALSNLRFRESLRAQSVRDPLTGLYNRRFLDEAMEIETHRAKRNHSPIGIIMIDIDHFKRFNDTFGHGAGDAMLQELGDYLHEQVREEDIPCRYGGEEFIIVLPGATAEASRERAEALRNGIGSLTFDYQGKPLGPITLSLGVACYPANGPSWQQTVKAADAALYRAKQEGRNRVCVAD